MIDDAVVGVPGIGVVGLCRAGIAVVEVDLGIGSRRQAWESHVQLELPGHGIVGDELPLQPGGLVAGCDDDVGAVGAGMGEQARLHDRVGDQHRKVCNVLSDQRMVDRDLLAVQPARVVPSQGSAPARAGEGERHAGEGSIGRILVHDAEAVAGGEAGRGRESKNRR